LERLGLLGDATLDVDSIRLEAIDALRPAVGFDRWCTLLLDPDTMVISGALDDTGFDAHYPQLIIHDEHDAAVHNVRALARHPERTGVLSHATKGDLARCGRWREIFACYGVGDELRTVAADELGAWSHFVLFRSSNDKPFDEDDARLMREASPLLARAVRTRLVRRSADPLQCVSETGVWVVDDRDRWTRTPAARAWASALGPAAPADGLPVAAWSVLGTLRASEDAGAPSRPARACIRVADGSLAVIDAARLDGSCAAVAITIRPATAAEAVGRLARASGLSRREHEMVRCLLDGLGTREISARLHISAHTVQDHFKSVFAKVGVNSRRGLLAVLHRDSEVAGPRDTETVGPSIPGFWD
jgi:DNA-binding CsgD family transcriptional regulator